MPIDWRPDIPIKAFIAYRTQHPKPKLAGSHINNANIDPVKQARFAELEHKRKPSAVTTTGSEVTREPHQIEGTLDTQKQLLQQLARRENAAQGLDSEWVEQSKSYHSGMKAECKIAEAQLLQKKKDTVEALCCATLGTPLFSFHATTEKQHKTSHFKTQP